MVRGEEESAADDANWVAEAGKRGRVLRGAFYLPTRFDAGKAFAQPHFTLTARSSMWPGSPPAAAPRTILLQRLDLFTKVTVGKEFG